MEEPVEPAEPEAQRRHLPHHEEGAAPVADLEQQREEHVDGRHPAEWKTQSNQPSQKRSGDTIHSAGRVLHQSTASSSKAGKPQETPSTNPTAPSASVIHPAIATARTHGHRAGRPPRPAT